MRRYIYLFIPILFIGLITTPTSFGAIAFDQASGIASVDGPTAVSVTSTAAGANLIAICGIFYQQAISVSSMTYGGNNMTLATRAANNTGGHYFGEQWYLLAPPTGAQTVTLTGSGGMHGAVGCTTYTGVKQSGQPDSIATSTGASTLASATTTIVATNSWVIGNITAGDTITALANSTDRNNATKDGMWIMQSDSNGAKSGSFGQSATIGSSANWGAGVMSIAPIVVATSTPGTPVLALKGALVVKGKLIIQ